MRSYCDRIQSNNGNMHNKLSEYEEAFRQIKAWYIQQYSSYSKLLQEEFIQKMCEDYRASDNVITVKTYRENFETKSSLFCVSEFLMKHILSTFSYGPENVDGMNFETLHRNMSWLEYKGDIYELVEILENELQVHEVGQRINLSVFLEDRNTRNSLTHSGKISVCLSAIRAYNVVRDMIVFMDPETESLIPRFTYSERMDCDCDMQEFFARTHKLNFDQRTSILVVGSLHDIPTSQRDIIANKNWDIIIDFDGYTEFGGLKTNMKQSPYLHSQLLTKQVADNIVMRKGITEWLTCGELIGVNYGKIRGGVANRVTNLLPAKQAFFQNSMYSQYYKYVEEIFELLISKVADKLNPVTIVYIYKDEKVMERLLNCCEAQLSSISYDFTGLYYWDKQKLGIMLDDVYGEYDENNNEITDICKLMSCDLHSFFKGLEAYDQETMSRKNFQTQMLLPSSDGDKTIPLNLGNELEKYFDVLYKSCGESDPDSAEQKISDFYHGSYAPWCAFPENAVAKLIREEEYTKWINLIKTHLGRIPEANKDKIFHMVHNPGIGGSTLLRQIGWDLHKDYPVLLIRKYNKSRISKLIQNLYDYLSRGIVILVDEDFTNPEDLERDIKRLPRACVLVGAIRISSDIQGGSITKYFSTILPEAERRLRKIFKSNSPLPKKELEKKDEEYDNFINQESSSMKCPFMIGLYYMDKAFTGIDNYVNGVIQNLKNKEKELKAVAFMALCEIYGKVCIPKVFINKYIGISPSSNYIESHEYMKSVLYTSKSCDTVVYKVKHYLISQTLLEKCCYELYGFSSSERLAELSMELIEAIFNECDEKIAKVYQQLLEKVFIKNRIVSITTTTTDTTSSNTSDFSELIEDVTLPEKRYNVLKTLAEFSEKLAKKNDPKNNQDLYMMTAHFYGHLSRFCSKTDACMINYNKAEEYSEKAMHYMEECDGQDSRVYHMYGEAKKASLTNKLKQLLCEEYELTEVDYKKIEDQIDEIMDIYSLAAQTGSPDYAYTSQMDLLISYLRFVYNKKNITCSEEFVKLSDTQQKYKTDIEEIISFLDDVELQDEANEICNKLVNSYRSDIILRDYGKVIQYYENILYNYQNDYATTSDIINARRGLINARLGKYRRFSKRNYIYYDGIPENELNTILNLIEESMEQGFDMNRYQARKQRVSLYSKWMQLAKLAGREINKGILVALEWKKVEEMDRGNDPSPYYYLYVLYYLSLLNGNNADAKEINKYQRLSYQKAILSGRRLDCIRDFFINGSEMGQLKDSTSIDEISNIIKNGVADLRSISGRFIDIKSKRGIVEIKKPILWINREAKFRVEEKNTLGEGQITHNVCFYAGFGYEQIIALDNSVKDIDSGEELPEICIHNEVKMSVNDEVKLRIKDEEVFFTPFDITHDYGSGKIYLNGEVNNIRAGLSSVDILQYNEQMDSYGDVENILEMLNNLSSFKVKVLKKNKERYQVSLFKTGKTLYEVLGEKGIRNETYTKLAASTEKNHEIRAQEIQKNDECKSSVIEEIYPTLKGEVKLKIESFTDKGAYGTFEKDGKEWPGYIPSGITKKDRKKMKEKIISANIISNDGSKYILKKK